MTVAILLMGIPASARAQGTVIWDGPTTTYSQAGTDPTLPADQDRLTSDVWLTRDSTKGLFNVATEASYTHNSSPADTEWAYGELANYASLTYNNWETWNGKHPPSMVGQDAVLHLISDNIYLSIRFTSCGAGGAGGFSYIRSTPTPVPEPANVALLGLGLAALFLGRRNERPAA
jgi:PEP-CTERM motif